MYKKVYKSIQPETQKLDYIADKKKNNTEGKVANFEEARSIVSYAKESTENICWFSQ